MKSLVFWGFWIFIFGSSLVFWTGVRIVKEVQFDQRCDGFLENAAHANQVSMVLPEMERAIAYLKENNLTDGFTSIFYRTQDDNIGFWYNNLVSATEELRKEAQNKDMSALEQSNVLMKLHETLKRPEPEGITIYPHNTAMMVALTLSTLMTLVGVIGIAVNLDL